MLSWLRNEQREGRPQGFIGFAVSARMSRALRAEIEATPEQNWQPYVEDGEVVKECAELEYLPEERPENRYREPLRHIGIRVRKKQQTLFADGCEVKYFAVVTNLWDWKPQRLLEWHREKAGSIEAVHDVIKNELAGGVVPCGRFGANAAWFRLGVISHNVLVAMKRLALPPELLAARSKGLRFVIFNLPGRLIWHARRMVRSCNRFSNWRHAWGQLPLPSPG